MMRKFENLFLQNGSLKQTMFKNIFWLMLSQVSRILRTITLLYAARILGATEYGTFSYVIGMVGLFSIFADLGLSPLLVREAGNPNKEKEYFATSFLMKITLVGLTSVIFYFFAPLVMNVPMKNYFVVLAIILIVVDNVRDFIVAYLRGLGKMERETLIATTLNCSLAIFGFIVLLSNPSAKDFFLIYIISSILATFVAIVLARKALLLVFNSFRKTIAWEILQNAWPIALSGTFGVVMLNIDIFMLGIYRTAGEIGLYSAGQKIIQIVYIIPSLLASGVFPTLTSIVKTGNVEHERNLNEKSISAIFLFTLPVVAGGLVLAESIFKLLFGHDYTAGAPAFMLLLLHTLILFPGIMISSLVLAHNKQRKMFKYIMLASLSNVVLNYLLIPKIGILGAALATLVAQTINYGFIWYEMKKISDFKIISGLKKSLLASLVMSGFAFAFDYLGVYVLLNIALSTLIYFGLLYLLKEKTLSDIKVFIKNSTAGEVREEAV